MTRRRSHRRGLTAPLAIVPAKPRKSRCGRLTHCTGRRNGAARRSSLDLDPLRDDASRCGPSNQGVFALRAETLSPKRAEIGIGSIERKPSGLAKSAKSATMSRNIASSKSTRSILLTASTTWRMPSSETMIGMAEGLRQQALARIDQDHREVGVGGAGRHVAGILLVAGRVGDDERARRRREIAIGDVDGDALLALGFEAVDQQREIDVLAGRAVLLGIALRARRDDRRRSASARRADGRSASICRRRPSRR